MKPEELEALIERKTEEYIRDYVGTDYVEPVLGNVVDAHSAGMKLGLEIGRAMGIVAATRECAVWAYVGVAKLKLDREAKRAEAELEKLLGEKE